MDQKEVDWQLMTHQEKIERCQQIMSNYPIDHIEREKINAMINRLKSEK